MKRYLQCRKVHDSGGNNRSIAIYVLLTQTPSRFFAYLTITSPQPQNPLLNSAYLYRASQIRAIVRPRRIRAGWTTVGACQRRESARDTHYSSQ